MPKNPLFLVNSMQGQALLEVVVVINIVSILFLLSIDSLRNIFGAQLRSDHTLEATQLAIEGLEFAYNVNVNSGYLFTKTLVHHTQPTRYYLDLSLPARLVPDDHSSAGQYKTVDTIYTRELWFEPARRNEQRKLVGNTETNTQIDPDLVKVVSRVFWENGAAPQSVELVTFLGNQTSTL